MKHGSIQFGKHTVTKTAAPQLMRVEVEKTRRAYEIAASCELFRVPKLLEFDEAAGTAVFERLHGIVPIGRAVSWGEPYGTLAKTLGAALAIVHRELTLPDDMRVPLPAEFALSKNEVYLHGDLTVDNVCVGASWPPIVILDWQMTPLYGGRTTHGTRYFDIFWFIGTLINRPKTTFLFRNPVLPVAKALIESYLREARLPYEPNELSAYASRFFDIELPRAGQEIKHNSRGRARLLWPRCRMIARAFVKSLQA